MSADRLTRRCASLRLCRLANSVGLSGNRARNLFTRFKRMSREVVFDIETQTQAGGPIKDMRVSIVVAYSYEDDTFHTFREEQLKDMWPLFERADRIIGYNSKSFDVPILQNYYAGDLSKIPHLDMLEEIKRNAGFRPKLDDIAKATLNTQKSGHGL